MSSIPQSEIKAICSLLKSSDENTLELLEEQLVTFDTVVLKKISDDLSIDDEKASKKFANLTFKVRRERLKKDFKNWCTKDFNDLEAGVFLIASFNNPLLHPENYSTLLTDWSKILEANLAKIKLSNDPTSIINEINHFLFMELGFKGNKKDYYNVENSFIDNVINKRLGNPILLSVVYLLITKRLGLSFSGVNMPAHFLVQYLDSFESIFIDPFNQGEIITKSDCKERIKALNVVWQDSFLSTPTVKQIISRIMQNLINIYRSNDEFKLKEYFEGYLKIISQ